MTRSREHRHPARAAGGFAIVLLFAGLTPGADTAAPPMDAFYAALLGAAEPVDASVLVAAPGGYVGRAVRTSGRLLAADGDATGYALALGAGRVRLRLEPEASAVVAAHESAWAGQPVTVEGLFYREAGDPAKSPYALRAWLVRAVSEPPRPPETETSDVPRVSLQDLVYGAGRYDGRVVRVRGVYRGPNRHADLPERTRKGRADWVIKEGYFSAWVTGREARGESGGERWDATRRSKSGIEPVVEVVGVPATAEGVVRISAQDVALSLDFVGGALAAPRDTGVQAVSPRVSFAWPIPGEPVRPPGHVLLQFSKPLDPQSLETRVRVRYGGGQAAPPSVTSEYRQRYRALIVIPEPPPPPGTDVTVELLEGIIDVDGRALVRRAGEADALDAGVVDAVRFRSAP